jgi:uncharacterized protein
MLTHVDWRRVRFGDGFLGDRVRVNRTATIPAVWRHTKETGRADALKLDWQEGNEPRPHQFWDSDVAKWIEAAAYDLAIEPNPETEAIIDGLVADMEAGQLDDGYLNSFYQQVCLDKRWSNLRDMHELYCAGHLMEAAVAYFQATGKRAFLDVMSRYADCIGQTFGSEEGKLPGYPGHEELELALVKLAAATGKKRYGRLASYFVNQRGQQPHYFDEEAVCRGEEPGRHWHGSYEYTQAHLPAKEQTTAEGHSVRACYFYSGMADVARLTDDPDLGAACRTIWANLTRRRMYMTGGIGSSFQGERFSMDHDLPNETSYAETCAQIALVFFASRMLQLEAKSEYADVMELAFYNSVLSGVSLDGERIFYVNPQAYFPDGYRFDARGSRIVGSRPEWHGCACCPSNLARLLASLGGYLYSTDEDRLYLHLYGASTVECEWAGTKTQCTITTDYPFSGEIGIRVDSAPANPATLCLRIPGWARSHQVCINGEPAMGAVADGYLLLERAWQDGDMVSLAFPMPVEMVEAHPTVRHDVGRVALKRGPLVYCLESVDNGNDLNQLRLAADPDFTVESKEITDLAIPAIHGDALRDDANAWDDTLYRPIGESRTLAARITAIPYFIWANRGAEEMLLWIRQA